MKVIAYTRVSTQDQAQAGVSLEAQEERIRGYCKLNGWQCVEVVQDDGYSAKDLKRHGLKRILDELPLKRRRFGGVVVTKLDRLTRSVRDLVHITDLADKHEVVLVSIQEAVDTATPTGQLFRNVITSIAEWERGIIGERTREALAYKRRNGERVGAIPYGFALAEDGKRLVPVPDEQKVLARIQKERNGGMAYRLIADGLNADRVPTKGGGTKGRWYGATIRSILTMAQKRKAVSGQDTRRGKRSKTTSDSRKRKKSS